MPIFFCLFNSRLSIPTSSTAEVPEFKSGKPSIILVTHDPHLAWSYADRVALLADGKLLAVGSPDEILSNKDLCTQAKLAKHPFVKSLIND